MVFIVFSLSIAPSAEAWTWKTHSNIVDVSYNNMPKDIKQKLNFASMRDGSNDPDEKFKDFGYHSYPKSYDKAIYWLNRGKDSYRRGDYNYASYCFGVASHYISDTFSAPHCVSGESSSLHTKYENQANSLTPKVWYMNGDLKTIMYNGYKQGIISWNNWVRYQNQKYVQNDLDRGAAASYTAIKYWITRSSGYYVSQNTLGGYTSQNAYSGYYVSQNV